ncbi:MAG: hypothetical protein ACI4AK_03255 [Lepagella sp.]
MKLFRSYLLAFLSILGSTLSVVAQSDPEIYSLPVREDWSEEHQGVLPWECELIAPFADDNETRWHAEVSNLTGIKSQDNDGYSCVLTCSDAERGSRLISPMIDISEAIDPSLVFYYYYTPNVGSFGVEVSADDLPFTSIFTSALPQDQRHRWIRVELSLADYRESDHIRVAFVGTALRASNSCIAIDNISISDLRDYDISIMSVKAPALAYANAKVRFELLLRNNGREMANAGDYRIHLYKNDYMVSETRGVDLRVDEEFTVTLADIPLVVDDAGCEYMAALTYDLDQNYDDNYSDPIEMEVTVSDLPGVENLRQAYGYSDRPSIALEWDEPRSRNEGQELREYRIYRDGFYIGKVDRERRRWVDDDISPLLTYSYRVSAVWKQGESPASQPIVVSVESRVESVAEDVDILKVGHEGITIGTSDRAVEVYDLAGRRVATMSPGYQQETFIPLAGGIYIVRYGTECRKVIIGGVISQ